MLKIKHYLRHENEVNKNKVLSYGEALRYMWNNKKTGKKLFSFMWNLHHFQLCFQKVDRYTRGKWLIHSTKGRKDNQLQSLELLSGIS